MSVINKKRILELAKTNNLLGSDYIEKNIKGCSYDLRIGTIFIQKKDEKDKIISIARNNDRIIEIFPSEIVTMLTLEPVTLPNDICGTVFPINSLSSKGLLILNPGHIDPGYSGPISICAINLSNEIIRLSLKNEIFTIIFDKLEESTDSYTRNNSAARIDYENDFYRKRASKLSPSIFDLITINEYIPHLREQIMSVIKEKTNNFLKIFFYILVGIATIFGAIYAIRSTSNNKVENLEQELRIQQELNKNLLDSLYIYRQNLNEIKAKELEIDEKTKSK
ncbi:MAG: hypothetical protein RBS81_12390 [Tenuifilaceae bacterium]|jgi:deoxycytidine triphosphate deaminase|nr:hypothetical protein [Tenuifilaceae bacterium]